MKTFVTILVAAAMAAFSLGASAGPDESQRMMAQQIMQAKQKLAAAEAAQGAARQKMMQEHMTMMQKTMGQMQAMKPGANMTPTEQKEWIAEHQKLMELMMGQMMDEHHLMLQMNCK
jgi:ABC-type transporter MlaC component